MDIGWLASGDDGLEGAAVDYRCELIKEQALSEPPSVCDETAIPRFCGDGVCLGDETLASCPADCGGERLEVYEGCQAALTFSVDGVEVARETIDLGDEAPYTRCVRALPWPAAAVPRVPAVWGSTRLRIQAQGETILDSGFDDEVNWWSMGGNLQEGVALGSRDASYFESTVTAGDMRSFQASYDGRMGDAGGGLAFRLLGDELAEDAHLR